MCCRSREDEVIIYGQNTRSKRKTEPVGVLEPFIRTNIYGMCIQNDLFKALQTYYLICVTSLLFSLYMQS